MPVDLTIRAPWCSASHLVPTIDVRHAVIVMILAATAVPIELRWPSRASAFEQKTASFNTGDFIANVVGFAPVGFVLSPYGPLRAIAAAALMSGCAETGQMFMQHRDPTPVDVIANVLGGILGVAVARRWRFGAARLAIDPWTGLFAAALALTLLIFAWPGRGDPPNPRGRTLPGTLEGRWEFDETQGREVVDSSGNKLQGTLTATARRGPGIRGDAAVFAGPADFVSCHHSSAFRLSGNMTITAWIRSSSYPFDDAAIVSQMDDGLGYQLDTTIDQGPRTLGFKLRNCAGKLMMRYGRTPLLLDTWYHVAGVYDARAETLDVYLNGKLDNGELQGSVTSAQLSSRAPLRIGKRAGSEKFPFLGTVDSVRLYSLALTAAEIAADMQGLAVPRSGEHAGAGSGRGLLPNPHAADCTVASEPYDKDLPAVAVVLGVLVTIALAGLRPSAPRMVYQAAAVLAGCILLLLKLECPLPAFNRVLMLLVCLAGGSSIAWGVSPGRGMLRE